MKKTILILISIIFVAASTVVFAAGGHKGGGSSHTGSEGVRPAPMNTPRGFGVENPENVFDREEHERKFDDAASGAWSNDKVPGKDKPSKK
jgi:hypothetical protein